MALDGTTNFIHGIPSYGISVGLLEGEELVMGIIYEPNADECFYAWKESAAYLNGTAINVSKNKTLKHSLLATGFPINNHSKIPAYRIRPSN